MIAIGAIQEDYLTKEQGGTVKAMTVVDRPSGTAVKVKLLVVLITSRLAG